MVCLLHAPSEHAYSHVVSKLLSVSSHAAGRSVLAMAEAYNYFKVHYADHEHERGTFKLTYMEGLTFADQVTV